MAVFKSSGKTPAERERFMIVVMGWMSESRQDFRSRVGIESKEQVASEADRIAARTSSAVAGANEGK